MRRNSALSELLYQYRFQQLVKKMIEERLLTSDVMIDTKSDVDGYVETREYWRTGAL